MPEIDILIEGVDKSAEEEDVYPKVDTNSPAVSQLGDFWTKLDFSHIMSHW